MILHYRPVAWSSRLHWQANSALLMGIALRADFAHSLGPSHGIPLIPDTAHGWFLYSPEHDEFARQLWHGKKDRIVRRRADARLRKTWEDEWLGGMLGWIQE
jgi:hypothetical protein